MNIIKNNPYRILGILVGTSGKDEHSKAKKLKMYVEAEQEVPEDFSFNVLGELDRSLQNIDAAISKLTLNKNRVEAALFWFYKGNDITDEPTFDAIKSSEEDAKNAVKTWTKLASAEDVTTRNASAFQNISTYYLNAAFSKTAISKSNLEKGVTLKLKFLQSDFFGDFLELSTDSTYKVTYKELQVRLLDEVYDEIENNEPKLLGWYLELITKIEFAAKQEYLSVIISKPIEQLNKKVEETKESRKANPIKAYDEGAKLYKREKGNLFLIENVLGKNNIQYSSVADKVAAEILQCGIAYFKKCKDTKTDPSVKSMELFKIAETIAVGSIARQKIEENIENLEEWIEEKPEREKNKLIEVDLKGLFEVIKQYDDRTENIENAKTLLIKSKPHLTNIKNVLGVTDVLYLQLSTRVVSQAQSYVIEEVNKAQEDFSLKAANNRYGSILLLKSVLRSGWEVTNLIGDFDMELDFKVNRFNLNKEALRSLCNQLDISTTSTSTIPLKPLPKNPISTPPITAKDNSNNSIWSWIIGIIIIIILINACS